ncbi:thiamine biosynthesis protein ThiJ [Alkaliphilus pronyensis]|uniref:Thiamine biosynthesis protein ThiJ n=1 Tax=Alkaliphilus pronyensis TaxID=1482732 RepID=A0A6I0F7E8_9FIRM|nr:DJ-1/PfpI family protein [Alkaliphilus pronyensis]KAB3538570.1 thiamine biosynthesis protein ThiJ [Alkaliphilus pronyensis]
MKKILVFIYDDMADFEITFLTHLLGTNTEKEIIPVAFEDKIIKSRCGMLYKPLMLVKDILVNDEIEGLIITGGWNGEIRVELMDLIKELNDRNKLLAAICAGPRFLAKAGVLKDKKYTTSIIEWTDEHKAQFNEDDPFPRNNFENKRALTDRNIITAQGVAFIDFAVEVCEWFSLFNNEKEKTDFLKTIKG